MKSLRSFQTVLVISKWVRERLSPLGLGVAALTLLGGIFGVDTNANYAHGVFALGVALLVVDFLASRRLRPQIEVTRVLPAFLTAGQGGRYTLIVRNRGAQRLTGLTLHERLRQPFPSAAQFSQRRNSVVAAANVFDRSVGYPDWIDWLRRLRCAEIEPVPLAPLNPGQTMEIKVAINPVHRGVAVFETVLVTRSAPLGLCQARCVLRPDCVQPGNQSVPVLPQRYALALPSAQSHRNLQPGGISLALRVGDSEEFRSLRDYRPGDPLRAIHWRSWARTGRPVVREYHDEYFSRHALVLDTSAPSLFDPAFEVAVSLAASFVVQPREADSLLDMLFVGDRVHRLTTGRGVGEAASLMRVLATINPSAQNSFQPLANTVVQGAAQIGSLVCILLSWGDAQQQFVRHLQALGVTPMVFVVSQAPSTVTADERLGFFLRWLSPGALNAETVIA
jgi:uncharacterized protein (DUF58 family)